jgi:hypothetical protein
LLNGEGGAIAEEQRFVILFDRIDTTATTWLGLTIACAQCHDHKYDPTTQRDYYSLMDAFNRVPEVGTPQLFSTRIRVDKPFLELPNEENKARIAAFEAQIAEVAPAADEAATVAYQGWRIALIQARGKVDGVVLGKNLPSILAKPDSEWNEAERSQVETELRKYFDEKVRPELAAKIPAIEKLESLKKQLTDYTNDQVPRVMIMSDDQPRETNILSRGEYLSPLEKVTFATPQFLPQPSPESPPNRLGLAQWLVDGRNPLTARVQVNRIWQYYFGIGLVKTSEDFGLQSEYPVHPELLDWLAVQFVKDGWSMKSMHRLIVTSATYRQSSRVREDHLARDPENRLMARATRIRMPSMILRDWALAASGLLDRQIGGAPVYPYQPDNVWESLAITKERDFSYPQSSGNDLYRRSLYTFWRRTVSPANMFDASNRQACRVRLATTSTPMHALTTLNDPTWVDAARALAQRSAEYSSELDDRLVFAFRCAACRKPTDQDLSRLRIAHDKQMAMYLESLDEATKLLGIESTGPNASAGLAERAALTAVCLAILNLDESLCRE